MRNNASPNVRWALYVGWPLQEKYRNASLNEKTRVICERLRRDKGLPWSLLRALNLELEFQKLRTVYEWETGKGSQSNFSRASRLFPFQSKFPSTFASTSTSPCPPGPRPQTMRLKTSMDYSLCDTNSSRPERTAIAVQHVHWDHILCRTTDPRPLMIFRNPHQSHACVLQDASIFSSAAIKSLVLVHPDTKTHAWWHGAEAVGHGLENVSVGCLACCHLCLRTSIPPSDLGISHSSLRHQVRARV